MTHILQYFAEGNDIKFLEDYITFLNLGIPQKFGIPTEGWTKLPKVANRFHEASNKGGVNIVIFDADNDTEARRKELLEKREQLGIEFELFLFPDDTITGCVENLLLNIINPKYQNILNCFDNYCNCISNGNIPIAMPPIKSKFYSFIEASGQGTNMKDVDFTNNDYGNLSHPSLNGLKAFIENSINKI
ncbi:MAG: hypothetical protein WKG06_45905 [Segetibacter sp.]